MSLEVWTSVTGAPVIINAEAKLSERVHVDAAETRAAQRPVEPVKELRLRCEKHYTEQNSCAGRGSEFRANGNRF